MLFLTLHSFLRFCLIFLRVLLRIFLQKQLVREKCRKIGISLSLGCLSIHWTKHLHRVWPWVVSGEKSESRTISQSPPWPWGPSAVPLLALPPSQHSCLEIMESQGVTAPEVVFLYWHQSVLEINTISGLHIDLVKGNWRIHVTNELEVADSDFAIICVDPAVLWEIPGSLGCSAIPVTLDTLYQQGKEKYFSTISNWEML